MFGISDQTLAIWMLESRTHGYTLRDFLSRNTKRYAVFFAIQGSVIAVFAYMESIFVLPVPVTAMTISFVCGALLRDLAWFGILRRQWPFRERTADWNEIERIAAGEPIT